MEEIKETSNNGIQMLISEEGFVKRPYKDQVGIPTIGVGMTYYPDSGKKVTMQDPPLTTDQVTAYLKMMVKPYELAVYSATRDDINHNQFDACLLLTYNIGPYGFKGSALVQRINHNKDDQPGIQAGFESWKNAGGKPILLARRKREAKLYFTSEVAAVKNPDQTYSDHVKSIQKKLGLILIDGLFGKGTKAAVIIFQRSKGLIADGIVGPQTLAELNKL